jgi:fluoride exporter
VSALVVVVTLVAGVAGALLRYGVSASFARMPARLPWAVLLVNVVGSLVGGVVLGLVQTGVISHDLRLILLTGFAGGLTTFSTLSVETIQLVMLGRWRSAVLSVVANVVLGVGAAVLGCCIVLLIAAGWS